MDLGIGIDDQVHVFVISLNTALDSAVSAPLAFSSFFVHFAGGLDPSHNGL